ncbi:BBE domain-containing protein [Streptomyces sp. NBC_01136]|nr:BBE domain-containing protein [Streptomyces sp. NBC_01136]
MTRGGPGCRARGVPAHLSGRYGGPETLKTLSRLKSAYDPANLFRRNYNVSG